MTPIGRIIRTDQDIAEGVAFLSHADPRLGAAIAEVGPLPLRLRPDGFAALLNAIISQQVSVASAAAIWSRMEGQGLVTQAAVRAAEAETLRGAGLSRQKIAYAQALAAADVDFDALRALPDAQVIDTLTQIKGIGIWTAQIYAMFSLGRADVFAPGDLALQEAVRVLYALPQRPTPAVLRRFAERWSPWRSVAARALFAYYRTIKGREGLL